MGVRTPGVQTMATEPEQVHKTSRFGGWPAGASSDGFACTGAGRRAVRGVSGARGGSLPAQFGSAARQPRAILDAYTIPSSSSERSLAVSIQIFGRPATGMSWLSPWATPRLPPS